MSAGASARDRVNMAHAILETFGDLKYDEREMSTTLILALSLVWKKYGLPIELFDEMTAAASRQISKEMSADEPGRPS
jgi:hypothetical protein